MPKLNFETAFIFKFKQDKDTFFIYEPLRKRWLVLTPEEWVRQHWVQYFLLVEKRSPSSLIAESKIVLNGTVKRTDLLITEKAQPKILVECKAPHIAITEETFEQIARYNSVVGAERILMSNGVHHICATQKDGTYAFQEFKF